MIQIFIFLLMLVQPKEIFCGGKLSKFGSSQNSDSSYKKIDQCADEQVPSPSHDYTIAKQLTTCTVTDENNQRHRRTQSTISPAIKDPTEQQILEACGRAMDTAYKMAAQQEKQSAKIAIIIEVDYDSEQTSQS